MTQEEINNKEEFLNIVENINSEEKSNNKLFSVRKNRLGILQSTPDLDPDIYSINRVDTGDSIGVAGKNYNPIQPVNMLEVFYKNLKKAGLNTNDMGFKSLNGGSRVVCSSLLTEFSFINQAGLEDEHKMYIDFSTSFDGSSSAKLSVYSYRLICSNGMSVKSIAQQFKFKNVKSNENKILSMPSSIISIYNRTKDYNSFIKELNNFSIKEIDVDQFITYCLDIDKSAKYDELSTRKKNQFRTFKHSVNKEINRTGSNAFALLNGATNYTNHRISTKKSKLDSIYLYTGKKINDKAQNFVNTLVKM